MLSHPPSRITVAHTTEAVLRLPALPSRWRHRTVCTMDVAAGAHAAPISDTLPLAHQRLCAPLSKPPHHSHGNTLPSSRSVCMSPVPRNAHTIGAWLLYRTHLEAPACTAGCVRPCLPLETTSDAALLRRSVVCTRVTWPCREDQQRARNDKGGARTLASTHLSASWSYPRSPSTEGDCVRMVSDTRREMAA